jgi:molybdate-binding protein
LGKIDIDIGVVIGLGRLRMEMRDVASDMADASFGVEAAARQFDLDFVRLVTEDYLFVCQKQFLESDSMKRVRAVMQGDEFQAAVSQLPGYRSQDAGIVKNGERSIPAVLILV